ncbi:MAG: M3 family oligoendopeptidase [Thermoleophilia bacterium]|nr:M3 family oligoendopeptidase [Thermoleophilia bacterium]
MTGAESVEWNLGDLYADPEDPRLAGDLDEALADARRFRERYHGRTGELTAAELAAATAEVERISSVVARVQSYAELRFTADTSDEARGALAQRAREQATAIETELLFFELEWAALEDDRADELLADPAVERYRNFLRSRRRYRPYLLSEPEERIDTEKSVTGVSAWTRLFDELVADVKVSLDDGDVPLDDALARLARLTEQEDRRATAEAVTVALEPGLRTRNYILNTVLNERAIEDRLRGYPRWISARNLANEISDEAVDSLVEALVARYDIPQRYYRLKQRLLGVDRLYDFDRFAPLDDEPPTISWEDARATVLEAFTSFDARAGEIVAGFFDRAWIDAALRPGKVQGAFCATVVPDVHPYVLMNYAGERRSVLTLAHELGHGLHGYLAQPLGMLNARTPLTLAETASVFGEAITFQLLLEREDDPRARLSLLTSRIEDAIATTFRQIAINRFEDAMHAERRGAGELSVERTSELWAGAQARMLGDSVELSGGYRSWWSYIPHFIAVPGYVYAYAFGYLFSLAIYRRYVEEGAALVEPIFDLLRAGGSAPPGELAGRVGFDIEDPAFWDAGLDALSVLVDEAEQMAGEVAG